MVALAQNPDRVGETPSLEEPSAECMSLLGGDEPVNWGGDSARADGDLVSAATAGN